MENYDEVKEKTKDFDGLDIHLVKLIAARACGRLNRVMTVLGTKKVHKMGMN